MRLFLLFIFLFVLTSLNAQRIDNLRLFASSGGSVTIKFTILPGPTCYGYNIMHSTDSLNFLQVYNYPGTCGGSGAPEDHSWSHPNPIANAVNYYKIDLIPYGSSNVARIYLNPGGASSLLVYPNPITTIGDRVVLRMYNTNNQKMQGMMLDQFGTIIRDLDLVTESDTALLSIDDLRNGFYVIWLTDGYNLFRTKLLINR
jgi:hypothetical protein